MKATLKTSKKVIIIILATLAMIATLLITAFEATVQYISLTSSAMSSSLTTLDSKVSRANNISDLSNSLDEEIEKGSRYVINLAFETFDGKKVLDFIHDKNMDAYLISKDGKLLKSAGSKDLNLSDTQVEQLIIDGYVFTDDEESPSLYSCIQTEEGLLITRYTKQYNLPLESLLSGVSINFPYFIKDKTDNKVLYSSNRELVGEYISENLSTSLLNVERNCRYKFNNYTSGFLKIGDEKAFCIECEKNDIVFGLFCSLSEIVKGVLAELIVPAFVIIATYILVLIFFFALWKDRENDNKTWIRIFKTKKFVELSQIKHLTCFALFVAIASLLFSTHYMTFTSYTLQSALSNKNLDMLEENLEASESDRECVVKLVNNYIDPISEKLADLSLVDENIFSHESLKDYADNCYINEISVYDAEGYLEVSSGDYSGYQLTQNPEDFMYQAWEILNSDKDYMFREYGDESGRYFMARKRKDAPGIICFKYENELFSKMLKYYSKDEAIRSTDFGNATTFFIKTEGDSKKTYIVEPYSTEITEIDIDMPEILSQNNYSGIASIAGNKAYVHCKSADGITITSAIDCSKLDFLMMENNLLLLLSYAVLTLILLLGCICEPVITEEVQPVEEKIKAISGREIKSMFGEEYFRKMAKDLLIILIIAYCIMMFKKTENGQTLIEFIFSGTWEKGLNIFALNASIIVAVIATLVFAVFSKIAMFICSSISNKAITLCNIVISLTKFLLLFFIILYALYQFGVNTTTLVASAGLAGMVIGIAAKDIFSDLIAGLFLVFEGNIRVGDFVKYKDFRAEVSEIGARVTVLKRYNNKLIVNNSDLKQYYRLSDELSCARVEIEVGPDEDIDKIRDLIENSQEWYLSRIPDMVDGPWFDNISEFSSSGITICLSGSCEEKKTGSVRRKILINTLQLFRENGITLGKDNMRVEIEQK